MSKDQENFKGAQAQLIKDSMNQSLPPHPKISFSEDCIAGWATLVLSDLFQVKAMSQIM